MQGKLTIAPKRAEGLDFFGRALEAFEAAVARAGEFSEDFALGPERMRWRFAGPRLHRLLTPALAHLRLNGCGPRPDLTICVFDSDSTGTPMPVPPWDQDGYGPRGEVLGFNDERLHFTFQPGVGILFCYDAERATAVYWAPSWQRVPYWEASFPGRGILHWHLAEKGYQPVHSAAVGFAESGVLIAGKSGSGKSTSALACLDSPLRLAGEDYVLAGIDPPWAYSLYSTAKLLPEDLHRFPHLAGWVSNPDRLDQEKALLYLHQRAPERLVTGFPLRAILIPKVTGKRDTRLAPATVMQAMMALGPTTLLHLQGATGQAMEKMKSLVRAVPVYTLEAGTELRQIPETIAEFLRGNGG